MGRYGFRGGKLECTSVQIKGDIVAETDTIAITSKVNTSVSSGSGTIKTTSTSALNSTGWLKIYVGSTAKYIPYFSAQG